MKIVLNFILLAVLTNNIYAQVFCGTHATQLDDVSIERFHSLSLLKNSSDSVDSVAITFHVVLHEWNFEEIPLEFFFSQLDLVNTFYFDAGIRFFMCGAPRYLQGDRNYNSEKWDDLNRKYFVPNTINIYYVDGIQIDSNSYCGVSTFPNGGSSLKSIIMDKSDYCNVGGKLLGHELGHFYGLLHTHETFYGNELVDGSNCRTAGDRLCDTPADPNLSNPEYIDNCAYVANIQDENGNYYNPLVQNIMSYSPLECQTTFTPNQISLINFNNEYINSQYHSSCDFYPDFKVSSNLSPSKLQSGNSLEVPLVIENLGMLDKYSVPLYFHLSEVEDEIGGIVHKDTIIFNDSERQFDKVINIDIPLNTHSQTHYITVVIDSEFEFIEQNENNNDFKISLEIDNSGFADEEIFPNPTSDKIKIFIRDPYLIQDYQLNIFDVSGKIVKSINGYKNEDELFIELNVTELKGRLFFAEMYFPINNLKKSFKFIKNN